MKMKYFGLNYFIFMGYVKTWGRELTKYMQDPGFLEKGFRCVKEGVCFADFISFFLNIL